jgi:hypothetical protein
MRALFVGSLLVSLVAFPMSGNAQTVSEVMAGLRNGGGWVAIPIAGGEGTVRSMTMPTAGLSLSGCINVWPGHSGQWEIRAHDRVADKTTELDATPGVGVPFSHDFGLTAQVDFRFHWSEARDTTLMMWVGLGNGGEGSEDACEPKYPNG